MKNENGLNQLNNNIAEHKSFNLCDNDGIFAKFDYDEKLKRYQSDYGWLSMEKAFELSRGKDRVRRWVEWIE